jgi:serine/threonine protein kinase
MAKKCPKCHFENTPDSKFCKECGAQLLSIEDIEFTETMETPKKELTTGSTFSGRYQIIEELGKEEGAYYITMEYVSGEDLKSFIRRSGVISVGKAISIAYQVCEGLIEAHRLGVVHRDLKPQNIMIDKEGNVRIMDFGIARSLRAKGIPGSGVMIGTPEYMSPEKVDGKEADQRADSRRPGQSDSQVHGKRKGEDISNCERFTL